jgi:hypothetical protein
LRSHKALRVPKLDHDYVDKGYLAASAIVSDSVTVTVTAAVSLT